MEDFVKLDKNLGVAFYVICIAYVITEVYPESHAYSSSVTYAVAAL